MRNLRIVVHALQFLLRKLSRRGLPVLVFSAVFRFVDFLVLAPLVATLLRLFLKMSGRVSVGNFELASFLLSPTGLSASFALGVVAAGMLYLELAGLIRLLARPDVGWWELLRGAGGDLSRVMRLGARHVGGLMLLTLPFVLGIWLTHALLWSGRDIYTLLRVKPPVFWLGAGIAGTLLAVWAGLACWFILRRLLTLPVLMLEPGMSPAAAGRRGRELAHGLWPGLLLTLVAWLVLQILVSTLIYLLLDLFSEWLLAHVGHSLARALPATAGLVALYAVAGSLLTMGAMVSLAGLVLGLYRFTAPADPADDQRPAAALAAPVRLRWVVAGSLAVLMVFSLLAGWRALADLGLSDHLEITAHRAGAARGPENSLAALRLAIEDGADWAEIDVQRTSDDAVVVFHDTDLIRFGGGNAHVSRSTLHELQQLDIGSAFGPEFAGERIPTFDAFLEAARGQPIRLTVELKITGPEEVEPLTRLTIAAIQRAGMLDRCRLCSQSLESLALARQIEPRLSVGWIAGRALGDVARMDVDFLMLQTGMITRQLVDRARARNTLVHAWTVKDLNMVAPLLDRGVENIITDDVAGVRARLKQIRALSTVDRLLLRLRETLAN